MMSTKLACAWRQNQVYLAIGIAIIAVGMLDTIVDRALESRWWRDVTGTTPFRNVVIDSVAVTDTEMRVTGSLEKRRCEKVGHLAYTTGPDGRAQLAGFHTEEADGTPEDRPNLDGAQAFGPWVITSLVDDPQDGSFWVLHRCRNDLQYNRVFRLPWQDFERED